jgi:hypothetical protein
VPVVSTPLKRKVEPLLALSTKVNFDFPFTGSQLLDCKCKWPPLWHFPHEYIAIEIRMNSRLVKVGLISAGLFLKVHKYTKPALRYKILTTSLSKINPAPALK